MAKSARASRQGNGGDDDDEDYKNSSDESNNSENDQDDVNANAAGTTTTTTATTSTCNTPNSRKKRKWISRRQANSLLIDCELAIQRATDHLKDARDLAVRAGLSVDSSILPLPAADQTTAMMNTTQPTDPSNDPNSLEQQSPQPPPMLVPAAASFWTGGHSNTDHVVLQTGDEKTDRVAELQRNLLRRYRSMQPENRGDDRWDKPRVFGERRRRIVRERDLPQAPPEPPQTGFVLFVGQMTTKIRHDRGPNVPHDQCKVLQEISKLWRLGMSEEDRQYYNRFSNQAKDEYERQVVEYRATGSYTPSTQFRKLSNTNVWVRTTQQQQYYKNRLELEITNYETAVFPKRPPGMDELYEHREVRSKFRRKLKIKGMLLEDGKTVKDGLDFETLFAEELAQQQKQAVGAADAGVATNASSSSSSSGTRLHDSEDDNKKPPKQKRRTRKKAPPKQAPPGNLSNLGPEWL